ncbi:MAG: DUF1761 domain-containing protein [Sphingobium sp.]
MKVAGINWGTTLAAAIAIYAVGFIIYGVVLDPKFWMELSGISEADMQRVGMARMVYSPVMPIMTAIGMAIVFKWGSVSGFMNGLKWGALIAFASAIPTILYGWVYGVGSFAIVWIDSAHLLTGHMAAGAILARWK